MSWFEAEFALFTVTMDSKQFNHEFVGLENKVIELVSDVRENCANKRLKEWLITCISVKETAKLNRLLAELTLGDRVPCQLLREIKQLGGDKVGTELLYCLCLLSCSRWLQRLQPRF